MPQLLSLRTFTPVTLKCFVACSMWRSLVYTSWKPCSSAQARWRAQGIVPTAPNAS
jgi:hypothetical protein